MTAQKGECSRCGECCKYIAIYAHHAGPLWDEFFKARGARFSLHELLIYSPCPHLIEEEFLKDYRVTKRYSCNIYDTRPRLCRLDENRTKFNYWIPPGCTQCG